MATEITMLNAMAAADFDAALDQHRTWGLKVLDLKDGIYGKGLIDLTDADAERAARGIAERGLEVYCFSSGLFHTDVEQGETRFCQGLGGKVKRLIELSRILRPRVIRLLGATTSRRDLVADAVVDAELRQPWLIGEYQKAIGVIAAAGCMATIENEVRGCILSTPGEVRRLFDLIDRPGKVMFTWDVQNMWQAGTYPAAEIYPALADITGYVHFKGGQSATPGGPLEWRCALEDSSYDVAGIVRLAVKSGRVPVLCLNPPHGKAKPDYDYDNLVGRDVQYLRKCIGNA